MSEMAGIQAGVAGSAVLPILSQTGVEERATATANIAIQRSMVLNRHSRWDVGHDRYLQENMDFGNLPLDFPEDAQNHVDGRTIRPLIVHVHASSRAHARVPVRVLAQKDNNRPRGWKSRILPVEQV